MPKTASDFTDEQRHALESVDPRFPVSAIVGMAQAGELAPGLKPFNVSMATVQRIRAEANERRLQAGVARDDALDRFDLGIIALMDQARQEIEAEARATGKMDLTRLRQLAGARKNMREANYSPGKPKTQPEQKTDTDTPSLIASLAGHKPNDTSNTSQDEDEEASGRVSAREAQGDGHAHARNGDASLSD